MANFEGKLNLNVETSEIEIKGKFKLTEEELDTVAGGNYSDNYPVVSPNDTCDDWTDGGSLNDSLLMWNDPDVNQPSRTCQHCVHISQYPTLGKYHCWK